MTQTPNSDSTPNPILAVTALGFPWPTQDPFLFCVYHVDHYPRGNEWMGPAASLAGRMLGQDFEGRDGWRMYHGERVPGFPRHPHRGFETVTIVRSGFVDHADSLGAGARYGAGDVQWLTAGRGIEHSEMFPLRSRENDNPLELFQIWLNLPSANKMAEPHFAMFWRSEIPRHVARDAPGRATEVSVVAGNLANAQALPPPPNSWAARADADVAIWTIKMEAGAQWTLPAAARGTNRSLYLFRGAGIEIAGRAMRTGCRVDVQADRSIELRNGTAESELLLLQGRPIGERVVQAGPFVMNSEDEIRRAFADYRATRFGNWPWPSDEPVHPREQERVVRWTDGRVEAGR
jgi:hypothetical protein